MARTRLLATAAVIAGTVLLLRGPVVEPLVVSSPSMEPTLPVGSTVVVDKLTSHWRDPGVGDVVVFVSPDDGRDAVKRVVAVGGQTVALRDAVLHVDGAPVDEPQVDLSRIDGTWFGPVTVPHGRVFVLGEARGMSIDSRTFGSVPVEDIEGRVVAVIGPP